MAATAMNLTELNVPPPSGIARESMADPTLSIAGQGPQGNCLCIYCPINGCGGVYWLENKVWFLVMPVDPAFFISSLEANGITMTDPVRFEEWRTEILAHARNREAPRFRKKN